MVYVVYKIEAFGNLLRKRIFIKMHITLVIWENMKVSISGENNVNCYKNENSYKFKRLFVISCPEPSERSERSDAAECKKFLNIQIPILKI